VGLAAGSQALEAASMSHTAGGQWTHLSVSTLLSVCMCYCCATGLPVLLPKLAKALSATPESSCREPVLALHRGHLEHHLRRYHPHPATNSMQELFAAAAVQETGKKCLMRQLMGFVARCEPWLQNAHAANASMQEPSMRRMRQWQSVPVTPRCTLGMDLVEISF